MAGSTVCFIKKQKRNPKLATLPTIRHTLKMQGHGKWRDKRIEGLIQKIKGSRQPCIFASGGCIWNFFSFLRVFLFFLKKRMGLNQTKLNQRL